MFQSILVPVDLAHRPPKRRALPVAVDLAKTHGGRVRVLTVIPDYGMPVVGSFFPKDFEKSALAASDTELKKLVEKLVPKDLLAESHAAHGTIYKEILATADAQGCDLIVLASHRPETSDYLLGPNAARVVRHADQSVFVVRA